MCWAGRLRRAPWAWGRWAGRRTGAPAGPTSSILRSETGIQRPVPKLKGLHGPVRQPRLPQVTSASAFTPTGPGAPPPTANPSPLKSWLSGVGRPEAPAYCPGWAGRPSPLCPLPPSSSILPLPPPSLLPPPSSALPERPVLASATSASASCSSATVSSRRAESVAFSPWHPHSRGLALSSC